MTDTPNWLTKEITIPIPDPALSPNTRGHWAVKARHTKAARNIAKICAANALIGWKPRVKSARVHITWFRSSRRTIDADNALARLKSTWDGFTDAGVWADDNKIAYEAIDFQVDKDYPRIEIKIESQDED